MPFSFQINNAGANFMDGTMNTDQSIDLYHKTFRINFQAVVEMIKKTKEHLIKTKGEIVNISAIAAGPQAVSGIENELNGRNMKLKYHYFNVVKNYD